MRTSLPVLPVKVGKGRQQTVSVGPVGILVMLCVWYPLVLAGMLAVVLAWALGVLAVRGIAAACRGTGRVIAARQARRAGTTDWAAQRGTRS